MRVTSEKKALKEALTDGRLAIECALETIEAMLRPRHMRQRDELDAHHTVAFAPTMFFLFPFVVGDP